MLRFEKIMIIPRRHKKKSLFDITYKYSYALTQEL